MHKYIFLTALLFLVSCTYSDNPQNAAERFWKAVSENKMEKAEIFSANGTMENTSLINNADVKVIEITGKHSLEKENAYVPTKVQIIKDGQTRKYEFNTVVVKENGEWKVDFNRTQIEMIGYSIKQFEESLKNVGRDMGKAIGEAMKEMGKAMGEAMEDMADKTREAVEKDSENGSGQSKE